MSTRREELPGEPATQKRATAPVNGTETAARVADVLVAVGQHGGTVGITELSERLGLSKSVVHRILATLVDRTLVQGVPGEPGRYTLGRVTSGWAVGPSLLRDITDAAAPVLRSVMQQSQLTATLALLTGDQCRIVGRLSVDQIHERLDTTVPLHAGAYGKAMLAFAPSHLSERVLSGHLPALTAGTVTDARRLAAQLSQVRRTHVAISVMEVKAAFASVASPVFAGEDVVAAIGVCLPAARLSTDRARELAEIIRPAAHQVSANMNQWRPVGAQP